MDSIKKRNGRSAAIYLLLILNLVLFLTVNELTLPFYLDTDHSSLLVTDLLLIRTFDLGLIGLSILVFILRNNPPGLINLGMLLGSILVTFVFTETILRVSNFLPDGINIYSSNPSGQGSFRLRKNYVKTTSIGNSTVIIETNSQGMHWENLSLSGSDDQQTIAFVGDSFTFGLWASHWSKGMVGKFNQALQDDNFRVLNFGVPGYGLSDILLQLKEVIGEHKPEHLILVSYMGNDILDTYLGLQRQQVNGSGLLEFQQKVLESKIPEEYRQAQTESLTRLISKFHISRFMNNVLGRYFNKQALSHETLPFARKDYGSNVFWSQSNYPQFALKALEVSLDKLREIQQFCEDNEINLLLVTLPSQEQVYYPEQFEINGDYDIQLPQRHFKELAMELDIHYFDLLPDLQKWTVEHNSDLHFRFDGHFNDQGHEVSGQLIAQYFRKNIIGEPEDKSP